MSVKLIKIILWFLLLYILQTVFAGLLKISGIMPELMLSFAVIFSFKERNFNTISYIAVISGILSGSIINSIFPIAVIVVGVSAVIAFYLKNIMKFIPGIVRCLILTAISAFMLSAVQCFAAAKTISIYGLYAEILPYIIYTMISVIIMYPILVHTFFKEHKEKKLLIV